MKRLFAPDILNIFSQLFINLSAGWFGVVLIIPGVTRLDSLNDILWLFKNLLFGILAVWISIRLHRKSKNES